MRAAIIEVYFAYNRDRARHRMSTGLKMHLTSRRRSSETRILDPTYSSEQRLVGCPYSGHDRVISPEQSCESLPTSGRWRVSYAHHISVCAQSRKTTQGVCRTCCYRLPYYCSLRSWFGPPVHRPVCNNTLAARRRCDPHNPAQT